MPKKKPVFPLPLPLEEILKDYRLAYRSRQVSLIGRREVLSGKAKFGIFGDGKETAQLAMARACQPGDWRSGYYRDQTWMFALGVLTFEQFFAQLYAHASEEHDPATAGRAMNAHFATRLLCADGSWRDQTQSFNVSADVSPTGSQMPRAVGLAYASVLYRSLPELAAFEQFSCSGREVTWTTIGNASSAEGMFWESVNAIGVLKAPAVLTVYDDGYGISVPNQFQMVKENIGEILRGFERQPYPQETSQRGYDLYTVRGWDYPALLETYAAAAETAREYHIPALVHVTELTQPQGHSTSGSHERYKTPARLQWEAEFDCLRQMRLWIVKNQLVSESELNAWEEEDRALVEAARKRAWEAYQNPILAERAEAVRRLQALAAAEQNDSLRQAAARLENLPTPFRRDIAAALHEAQVLTRSRNTPQREALTDWAAAFHTQNASRYDSHLYSHTALNVPALPAQYAPDSPTLMGFEIINAAFDLALAREPRLIAFGEDVGKLGDVNQGFRGMQEKYGPLRVSDTGIREVTILGQAIGLALRGLRPIAEIQYLDYLLYVLQLMSDDLATLRWRTAGGQKAPVIVRTRGHRLEGIWHSGSPMAGILSLVRGMYLLTPRNMTQAAGFYNTLLLADEPAIVVEPLNGYRIKEKMPLNLGAFTLRPGQVEVLRPGSDVTLLTYGSTCRIAQEAASRLAKTGIEVEIIDAQSLLPFDLAGETVQSLRKTSRLLIVDEDVPGGASAYLLQQVLEVQNGYQWLDSPPCTLTGTQHRPAYGSDGDYWSKPNAESIFNAVYSLMREANPRAYPALL